MDEAFFRQADTGEITFSLLPRALSVLLEFREWGQWPTNGGIQAGKPCFDKHLRVTPYAKSIGEGTIFCF